MDESDSVTRRMRLDVSLAEYNRAWAEIAARFTNQLAAFTIFSAGIAGALAFGKITEDLQQICLLAPLFIAPLGYIFFDNELQIWRVATYTRVALQSRIAILTGDDAILGLDAAGFETSAARSVILPLSLGRWAIFLIPACAAIAVAFPTARTSLASLFILMLDVCFVILLCFGIRAALAEQVAWRNAVCPESSEPQRGLVQLMRLFSRRNRAGE